MNNESDDPDMVHCERCGDSWIRFTNPIIAAILAGCALCEPERDFPSETRETENDE